MSSSCVTSTMVRRCVLFSDFSRVMISWLFAVSRLPVGSSANITSGSLTSARDGHSLLLTAGQFRRGMVPAVGEDDLLQRMLRFGAALGFADAAIDERELK